MKCARLHLCERKNAKAYDTKKGNRAGPRRFCQQKMANPHHEEDSRWTDAALERFRVDNSSEASIAEGVNDSPRKDIEEVNDLFLTVMNINFPADLMKPNNTKSSVKYKMLSADTKGVQHRMFVKHAIENLDQNYDGIGSGSSQADYKLDDYVKNILNENYHSRPSTTISGYLYQNAIIQHKSLETTVTKESIRKPKETINNMNKSCLPKEICAVDEDNTTIKYQSIGKRRSLTISRTQSPETVQVIRVDVFCNYSARSSINSHYADYITKEISYPTEPDQTCESDKNNMAGYTRPKFSSKYFLTNSIKKLDESTGGGEKVTLLCKTFKLSNRSKQDVDTVNKNKTSGNTKNNQKGLSSI